MINSPDYLYYCVDANKKLLYSKWLRPVSSEEYREGLHFLYDVVQSNSLILWLINNQNVEKLDVQDQKWLTEEYGLLLMGSPLKFMANVFPESAEIALAIKAIRDKAYRIFGKGMIVDFFEDEETALAWLLPHMQHYRLPKSTDNAAEFAHP
jgi:hypothetical protein